MFRPSLLQPVISVIAAAGLTRGSRRKAAFGKAMATRPGVDGLWDMGGNVWEWVDSGKGSERVTRSASWWYGPERQKESDLATKPVDTRVAYIGFRCVQMPSQ